MRGKRVKALRRLAKGMAAGGPESQYVTDPRGARLESRSSQEGLFKFLKSSAVGTIPQIEKAVPRKGKHVKR